MIICCLLSYCLSNEKLNSIAIYYKQDIWRASHLNLTSNLTQCDTTLTLYISPSTITNSIHRLQIGRLHTISASLLTAAATSTFREVTTWNQHHRVWTAWCICCFNLTRNSCAVQTPQNMKLFTQVFLFEHWLKNILLFFCPQFEWCPLTIRTLSSTKYTTIRYQNHKLNSAAALNYSRHDFFLE